jgi:hypothetical protein
LARDIGGAASQSKPIRKENVRIRENGDTRLVNVHEIPEGADVHSVAISIVNNAKVEIKR